MKLAIYLSGSIKKEHETGLSYWGDLECQTLKQHLSDYDISFLNPAFRTDDLSDQRSVFGRDMLQVFCSDVVFVDARHRRGLGVGAEMMWAKMHKIPVVTLAPKDTHYHKTQTSLLDVAVQDWVHPFIESLSDVVVETLEEGAAWICNYLQDSEREIKGVEFIESSMDYYKEHQLSKDHPMKELVATNPLLSEKLTSEFSLSL